MENITHFMNFLNLESVLCVEKSSIKVQNHERRTSNRTEISIPVQKGSTSNLLERNGEMS